MKIFALMFIFTGIGSSITLTSDAAVPEEVQRHYHHSKSFLRGIDLITEKTLGKLDLISQQKLAQDIRNVQNQIMKDKKFPASCLMLGSCFEAAVKHELVYRNADFARARAVAFALNKRLETARQSNPKLTRQEYIESEEGKKALAQLERKFKNNPELILGEIESDIRFHRSLVRQKAYAEQRWKMGNSLVRSMPPPAVAYPVVYSDASGRTVHESAIAPGAE